MRLRAVATRGVEAPVEAEGNAGEDVGGEGEEDEGGLEVGGLVVGAGEEEEAVGLGQGEGGERDEGGVGVVEEEVGGEGEGGVFLHEEEGVSYAGVGGGVEADALG